MLKSWFEAIPTRLREAAWTSLLILLAVALLSSCGNGQTSESPTPTSTIAPTPTTAVAHTPTSTPAPTPTTVVAHTPTSTPVPTPTTAPAHTPTPTPTSIPTPTPAPSVELVLDADASVDGYWSDGTANVEVTALLRNDGEQSFNAPLPIFVTCSPNTGKVADCGRELSMTLTDGFGPVSETFTLRLPMGKVSLSFDSAEDGTITIPFNVPERILGVDREVWRCFSDTSEIDKPWMVRHGLGVGCGGWTEDWVLKWWQTEPLKVWIQGQDSWVKEFLVVLDELSPVLNLSFERTQNEDEADIVAYIGVPRIPGGDLDETCWEGALGCAKVKIRFEERIYYGQIRVHNDGTDREFADLDVSTQWAMRLVMLHEAIHALTWMQHRSEPGSVMLPGITLLTPLPTGEGISARAIGRGINPMDEALLRLHAHPLVEPGMAFQELGNMIVFNDELLDPQPRGQLASWKIVKNAYDSMREVGSAQFTIRTSSAGCNPDFGWANYEVANITPTSTEFRWVKLQNGSNAVFTIHSWPGNTEYWSSSEGDWQQVSQSEFAGLTAGWRSELVDPHSLLTTALYSANWDEAELIEGSDGLTTLRLTLDLGSAMLSHLVKSADVVLTVDPDTFALVGYQAAWSLADQNCKLHHVEARDGQLTANFEFPSDIWQESTILATCGVEVDELAGFSETVIFWARQCKPSLLTGRSDGFAHTVEFSLSNWSIVRAEVGVEFVDAVYVYLLSDSTAILMQDAGDPWWDAFLQKLLPPGSYSVEVVSDPTLTPQYFALWLTASKVPPPPHQFKYIEASGRTTCGLLVGGTPFCWGNDWGGKLAAPEGESFTSLAVSNTAACGLRADGTLACWGLNRGGILRDIPPAGEVFKEISAGASFVCGLRNTGETTCWGGFSELWETNPVPVDERFVTINSGGDHACGLRTDGTAVCWGSNIHGQSSPPDGERFTSISSGDQHSCGLREDGSVLCWGGGGSNRCSILTDGTLGCVSGPEDWPLAPPEDERLSSISSNEPVCGLRTDGTPTCWGNDPFGSSSPPEGERFSSISSSGAHSCGLRPDGTVVCWGWDQFAQSSPPFGTGAEE